MLKDLFHKKEFVAKIGFVFGNAAILVLGGWFLTLKIMTSSAELKDNKATLEAIYQSWQDMRPIENDLKKIGPEMIKIEGIFVLPKDQIELLKLLEDLAKRSNNLYNINLPQETGKEKKEEKSLSFQIHLAGSFPDLMHFLRYLENMKYQAEIQSLQIDIIGEQGVPGKPEWENLSLGSVYSRIALKVYTQ